MPDPLKPSLFVSRLTDRAVLRISGDDRETFLDGLLTNSWATKPAEGPLYAALLTPQGKLLYDMIVVPHASSLLLDVSTNHRDALTKRLSLYKLRAKVVIDPQPDWEVVALWGDLAGTELAAESGTARPFGQGILYADPRAPGLGARLMHPAGEALQIRPNAEPTLYRTMRVTEGIAEGPEIGDEKCYPLEANFEPLHGVDFKKGCYVGQELTARMKHRGGVRKRVIPVHAGCQLDLDHPIMAGDREIGQMLAVEGSRGLALLRLDRLADAKGTPLMSGASLLTLDWPAFLPPLEQLV